MTQKGLAPILIVLILATLVGGYLLYQKQAKPTPSPQPTTQSSPNPTDETANWKIYTITNKLRFRYPSNYTISTNGEEIVSIADKKEKFTPTSEYITIDARLIGVYTNYDEAVRVGTEKLINDPKYKIENFKNGIKVVWNLEDTLGKGKNSYSTLVYLKYKGGAITAQFNDDVDGSRVYDKIVNTFEVLD